MKHKLTGEGGKGSQRRNANDKAYADGWEKIFGKKKKGAKPSKDKNKDV
jgi:hypothetical protein